MDKLMISHQKPSWKKTLNLDFLSAGFLSIKILDIRAEAVHYPMRPFA